MISFFELEEKMQLFDTHAHYNDEKFDEDRQQVIKEVYEAGVTRLVNAGYSLQSSKKAWEIAKNYPWMYVTCGISPNDIPDTKREIDKQIKDLKDFTISIKEKVVAIGEIGLDYHWNKENAELQHYAFINQIKLANELDLPIVIHTRDAVNDTIDILRNKVQVKNKGIFHCCPLNRELVKQALNMDFYISFAGPITFKNSKNADEIVGMTQMDRIVIETDSPYLAPEPHRGTRNNSMNVRYVAEKIAEIRSMNVEDVAEQTYKNALKVFKIEKN